MLHKQFAALGIESDAERIAREAKEALKPKKPIEISTPAQPTRSYSRACYRYSS